jgi:hypothetical protein
MVERHHVAQAKSVTRYQAREKEDNEDVMTGSRRTNASHWFGVIGWWLSFFFILALIIR